MLQLTPAEAALIVAAIGLVSSLLGWLGRGLTFVLRRWWTGAPRQGRAAYLNSLTDIAGKLRANGMTLDDVRKFEAIMHGPAITTSTAASEVVAAVAKDAEEPSEFQSNGEVVRSGGTPSSPGSVSD